MGVGILLDRFTLIFKLSMIMLHLNMEELITMHILIKRKKIAGLIAEVKNISLKNNGRIDSPSAAAILQLSHALGRATDARLTAEIASQISEAIEIVYEMTFEQFINTADRIVQEIKRTKTPIQPTEKDNNLKEEWEVTFFNKYTKEEVTRKFSYKPSIQYLKMETKYLKATGYVIREK